MIKPGDKVWRSGGAWDREELVEVTEENVKYVNMFFNRLYFNSEEEAALVTNMAHAEYGEYQAEATRRSAI